MKKFLIILCILLGGLLISSFEAQPAPVIATQTLAQVQKASGAEATAATKAKLESQVTIEYENDSPGSSWKDLLKENWGALTLGLLAFVEIIVRITPSITDNSIVNFISNVINAILPNYRKGGGNF